MDKHIAGPVFFYCCDLCVVQAAIDGKANVLEEGAVKIGDSGKTISRLNPTGKALINKLPLEVQTQDGFIDEEKDIVVTKVLQNKIYVKLSE